MKQYVLSRFTILFMISSIFFSSQVKADPCLLAYPDEKAVFQFDPSRYILLYAGDSLYDPIYDRCGAVLWDLRLGRIAYELYQAPGLQCFRPGYIEKNAFDLPGNSFTLYIDGFYHVPRRLNDIYVHFQPTPANAEPVIYVNDESVRGLVYYIPSLVVSTPDGNGFYSDKISLKVVWSKAQAMNIMVFSDKNANGVFDGEPCYNIFMLDQTVPVENSSWGGIKAMYEE